MAKAKGDLPKDDIRRITDIIVKNADKIRLAAFQTVKGQMARRIFTQGTATDGSPIGSYQASTKRTRTKAGRQVAKVDLSMTQTLERSFGIGTSEGRSVIGMTEVNEPKISVKGGRLSIVGTSDFQTTENAITQEKNFNKEIFAPSKEEIERGEKTIIKEIDRYVKAALR